MKAGMACLIAVALFSASVVSILAYDLNEKFSAGGILSGAYQYQKIQDETPEFRDEGRGGITFQPELGFKPTSQDAVNFKLGFGAGNVLKQTDPEKPSFFALSPWNATLENDVKDINGRDRDYLLTAWYRHTFQFSSDHTLSLTGGIIDATDYLDQNVYSGDEYNQFLNEALDNGPNVFAPTYDIGGVAEWAFGRFSAKGVVMNVGKNSDGNNFDYYAVQFGYHPKSRLGRGNYRISLAGTSKDFIDPADEKKEPLAGVLFSFDQEVGEVFGVWTRVGWRANGGVRYKQLYSGGIDIKGKGWNRVKDNIGIGYAWLSGGNLNIDHTHVFETYYRFVFNDILSAAADVQYMEDLFTEAAAHKGWILGVRITAGF